MKPRSHLPLPFAALAATLALGCAADFDPPSEIKTLRVLAVQKSEPYASPGEKIELSMLWHDGSPNAPRPVQLAWFSGCVNPPGDLYLGCFEVFAELASASGGRRGRAGLPPGLDVGLGERFELTIPADIISSRPPSPDPDLPPYGLAMVFFAACAGELGPAPEGTDAGFPIACYGPDDQPLGADDFVAGYSAIYAFDGYRNQNPSITGFAVRGEDTVPACIGDACIDTPAPDALDCSKVPCIPACADNGADDCPEHSIKPAVDPASAEIDQVSVDAYGDDYQEQMWIRYYVSRGSVKSDVRLLNDARKGWSADYGTEYRAPKQPGPATIWAVVHDNRGGVSWVRQDVLIE